MCYRIYFSPMTTQEKKYLILAYYHLIKLENPQAEVAAQKEFFANKDVTARIYISEQGINGQMSASQNHARAYIDWMQTRAPFENITFKLHAHHEHVFPRLTVKYRKQLVALDRDVDFSKCGEHVPPEQWKEMLQQQDKVLIDVRNDYEWKIGHFEGSELPKLETFRDFTRYAEELKSRIDQKKTPIMMYCTGGIRCELFSSLLKEHGFEKIYQLDGGVINYGLKEGSKHWKGKLFVFDDRLAVPLCEEKQEIISACHHCGQPNDTYYNCANMDCNELFLCCPDCLKTFAGCCQESCKSAERLRPYHHQEPHKPFKKRHHYAQQKE